MAFAGFCTRVSLAAMAAVPLFAQADWPNYGNDLGSTKFSTLNQINATNVARLTRAWTYHTAPQAPPPDGGGKGGAQGKGKQGGGQARGGGSEATPLVINGVMYVSTGYNRVVALEPETGKEIWTYEVKGGQPASRGVSFWPGDKKYPPQVLFGTSDGRLIALNAHTGIPVPGFGNEGSVNLRVGVNGDKYPDRQYAISSPPAIYKHVVITGSRVQESPAIGPSGDVRGWDARTGKLLWQFHSVPRPGEPGHETWEDDGWIDRSGANAWGMLSIDNERGIVYLPFGQPSYDFYGGDRKGANLYGDSLVALDAVSGKMKWYFQTVHHDIWDFDLQAAPMLVDLNVGGRKVPAVAQFTKTTLLFLFDRRDGKPLFPIEERPVMQTDVPTEKLSATQPIPTKPGPLGRSDFKPEDLSTVTPEHAKVCQELFEKGGKPINSGMFTPWLLGKATINFPAQQGGGNWGGGSVDPRTGMGYFVLTNLGGFGQMIPARTGQAKGGQGGPGGPGGRGGFGGGPGVPYEKTGPFGAYSRFWDPDTLWPCTKPPWGELVAVDMNKGEIAWRAPLGIIEELENQGIQGTGAPSMGGNIVTGGGLIFVGASNDSRFRAFDSKTGKELWVTKLDAGAHSSPMTYRGKNGKQYVVVMANGGGIYDTSRADTLDAFALP